MGVAYWTAVVGVSYVNKPISYPSYAGKCVLRFAN